MDKNFHLKCSSLVNLSNDVSRKKKSSTDLIKKKLDIPFTYIILFLLFGFSNNPCMHADIVSRKHPSEINTWCCILHEISEIEGNEWNERERERGICFLSFTFSLSQMELESGVSTSQKNPAKVVKMTFFQLRL